MGMLPPAAKYMTEKVDVSECGQPDNEFAVKVKFVILIMQIETQQLGTTGKDQTRNH